MDLNDKLRFTRFIFYLAKARSKYYMKRFSSNEIYALNAMLFVWLSYCGFDKIGFFMVHNVTEKAV